MKLFILNLSEWVLDKDAAGLELGPMQNLRGENMVPLEASASLENETVYAEIMAKVAAKAEKYLKHGSIAQEITNAVVLNLMIDPEGTADLQGKMDAMLEREMENYVSALWQFTFGYALSLLDDIDKAQDVTQSTIVEFLSSKRPIVFVKGWLRQTAHNLAMHSYKTESVQKDIARELDRQIKIENQAKHGDQDDLRERITTSDVKRLLSSSEYSEWCKMHSARTLKDYAASSGQLYSQVRKRKHILSRKIKSSFLREQGWQDTPEILDYQTLLNIKRFLATLAQQSADASPEIYRYCPKALKEELKSCLEGISRLDDWGIQMQSANTYQVAIVDASDQSDPRVVLFDIKINRSNQIRITATHGTELMGVASEDMVEPLALEKGRCLLGLEEIKRLTQ